MHQELVISQNIGGQLQIHTDWPSSLRNKGVYFVKRDKVIYDNLDIWSMYVFSFLYLSLYLSRETQEHFQEPIPHLDEGLNNKEMNEQLLNYLTCGDVHPNVLGQYSYEATTFLI